MRRTTRESRLTMHAGGDVQTELFPPVQQPVTETAVAGADAGAGAAPHTAGRSFAVHHDAEDSSSANPPLPWERRVAMMHSLLELCAPVKAGGKAAAWLKEQRIFKKTWDTQGLCVVNNYRRISESLLACYALAELQACGLFNKDGHFRFYRHSLLIPWFDKGAPVHLEAWAPEEGATPQRLTTTGPLPCPYNAPLLDGSPGRLYVCEGTLKTLQVLEAGFPAVGLPRTEGNGKEGFTTVLKKSWLPRFRDKTVFVAFDGDAAGEAAAAKVIAQLAARSVEAHRLVVPVDKGVSAWFAET